MKKFILFTGIVFACIVSFAQSGIPAFRPITTQHGLSNNWVRCIYQDDNGYIWFATADGLNRFDGYEIKVFRLTDEQGQSQGGIHFNAVLKKNDHELWICTDMGVYTFDFRKQENFYDPFLEKTSVLCIAEDKKKRVWFGTNNGLCLLNPADSILKIYSRTDGSGLSDNYVNTLFIDSENALWIGTKNGLNRYDEKAGSFTSFQPSGKLNSLSGKDVMSICEDHNKRLWVGTAQDGLDMLIKDGPGQVRFVPVMKGGVSGLLVDSQNTLWIARGAVEGLGNLTLAGFVPGNKPEIKYFRHNPADMNSLSNNSVICFLEDKMKDIWIGTVEGGVNFTSPREKKFHSVRASLADKNTIQNNMVNVILEEDEFVWIGTEGGLDRLNKKTGRYTHYQYESNNIRSLGASAVFALCKDSRGNLWVGTWSGGLNRFDYKTGTFTRYQTEEDPHTISSNNVVSILEDSRGNLWIGTQGGGLNCFNYGDGTFRRYVHNDTIPNSLYHESVNKIFETSEGKLYLSTYFSLDEFNYEKEEFTHFIFDKSAGNTGGKIISIAEDSRKNIWIATNQGLQLFDDTTGSFIPYLTADDLPNNIVYGILEDSHSNLWISTGKGLYEIFHGVFRPEKPEYRAFYRNDGLAGDEFIKRAAFKNKSGTMYFGTSGGYSWFHPDSITLNTSSPAVVLTEFQLLFAQPDKRKKYTSIPENINVIDTLYLSHRNSAFTIHFAALNYLHPEKNKYQFQLEGLDNEWIDAGNQRTATYTNIQPGKYVFRVKGSNNDGVWSETPKSLTIIIRPPWWKTLFFKIVFVLGALILLFSVPLLHMAFLRRQNIYLEQKVQERTNELTEANTLLEAKQGEILNQNKELAVHRNNLEQLVEERTAELVEAKIKAEESDRLKSSFLANMSHEIRTPMNAIYGFSRLLNNDALPKEEKKHFLEIISTNCESLLVLINDILDISILEANRPSMSKDSLDVYSLLMDTENQFMVRNQKDIQFEFVNKNAPDHLYIINDKVRFSQVFNNLLNNAYKYTDEGKIQFGYKVKENTVLFFVSDTGIGIDNTHLEKIFHEFYKIEDDPRRFYRGTGIGLAICKKIVELMGGTIWVESLPGKGSTFYFSLPYVPADAYMKKPERTEVRTEVLPSGLTIIAAEDDATNYELLRLILEPLGAEIVWAKDGAEAVRYIKNATSVKNCFILMDIRMPNLDGYEAARQIREIDPAIPIIAVTAYAQKTDREKIMKKGFDGYLSKPVRMEELLSLITKLYST